NKKKRGGKGEAVSGNGSGVSYSFCRRRTDNIRSERPVWFYCGGDLSFCLAALRVRIYNGTFEFFRRKAYASYQYSGIAPERCDPGRMAGLFFNGSVSDGTSEKTDGVYCGSGQGQENYPPDIPCRLQPERK